MKFALQADQRIEATPNALGVCPCCGTEMIAKCGNRKVWHWAHKTKQTCDHWWENETQWHRDWKDQFPVEWQEVVHFAEDGEKHIADVKTSTGLVIEFQHSSIKREEIEARTHFYKNIIWIVDENRSFKRNQNDFRERMARIKNEELDYSSDFSGSNWGSLKVPIFIDTGIDGWVIGQVPQSEADFGFYKSHYLQKDYFIRSLIMSGRYLKTKMKSPAGQTNRWGTYFPPDNLYDFLKAEN